MNAKLRNNFLLNHPKGATSVLLSVFVAAMLVTSLGGLAVGPAFGATPYSNVQVFVQTTNITEGMFTIAAYNSSGTLVASTQTVYPAAAFELPNGEYLFTVTAQNETQVPTPVPLAGEATSSGSAMGGSSSTPSVIPIQFVYPDVEYGYLLQQISGPVTLNINTVPIENITLTNISVKVQFVNGTAAAGAFVSASVVGAWYWWYGPAANLKLSAQTGADGIANLTVPTAPVEVDAWDWIRVNLPPNSTTVAVNIGGETVNVTVQWEPIYVGLGGSALLIPPQNSTTITLHVQGTDFWVLPMAISSGTTAPSVTSVPTNTALSGSISNSPAAVPASLSAEYTETSSSTPAIQDEIPPITETLGPVNSAPTTPTPVSTTPAPVITTPAQPPATKSPTTDTGVQSSAISNLSSGALTTGSGTNTTLLAIAVSGAVALALLSFGIAVHRGKKTAS